MKLEEIVATIDVAGDLPGSGDAWVEFEVTLRDGRSASFTGDTPGSLTELLGTLPPQTAFHLESPPWVVLRRLDMASIRAALLCCVQIGLEQMGFSPSGAPSGPAPDRRARTDPAKLLQTLEITPHRSAEGHRWAEVRVGVRGEGFYRLRAETPEHIAEVLAATDALAYVQPGLVVVQSPEHSAIRAAVFECLDRGIAQLAVAEA